MNHLPLLKTLLPWELGQSTPEEKSKPQEGGSPVLLSMPFPAFVLRSSPTMWEKRIEAP